MVNKFVIINVLGFLMLVESAFMLIATLVSLIYMDGDTKGLLLSVLITAAIGAILFFSTKKSDLQIFKREGFIIVSLVWVVFSFLGSLPYILTGAIPNFTNAFFETISGFTTTGSSILNDIEALPHGILFWRSITQWMGGMGIIVLSIAILPVLGIGGMQLYAAEVPGPTPDKLHPRIRETAKRLWGIYLLFTLVETLLLWAGDMGLFDAVCHSLTTMATGGYSTKQASIGHWDSMYIQYVIIFFMFLAGVNFTLSYFGLHMRFRDVFKDEEFKWYSGFVLLFFVLILVVLFFSEGIDMGLEEKVRTALFTVVSLITTTGYGTSDYLLWAPYAGFLVLVLMFMGGMTGSTGGSMKTMRILLLLKNAYFELKRLVHPKAVIPVRYNGHALKPKTIANILAFVSIYVMIFVISTLVMNVVVPDMDTAMSAVATSLGNVGPGLGGVGPMENFYYVPDFGKWFLSFLMLIGRLELFTVLALFTPVFWRA